MNKLMDEASPYLKQHANNPVNWYPWGKEALEEARKKNKPILLSIGYAACHWCHVMAHESFEDNETAELMNQNFINIKVDREERPDLDKIYQTTHYLLTQHAGGWPLTVFISPYDLSPFFSGTYFPPQNKYQLPSFKTVLRHLAELYQKNSDNIKKQNSELLKILNEEPDLITSIELNLQPIQQAQHALKRQYDDINGGFGTAPKFPQVPRLNFLLHYDEVMLKQTLTHMAQGGVYDQLAGGFFRYAVDASWQIPHFEKMLYDNAQLLMIYTLAFKQFGNTQYGDMAHSIADWIIHNMQSPEGGYDSSIDADSEGEEGKYYIWDKQEIAKLLTESEFNMIANYFGLNNPANFEQLWHLYVANPSLKMDLNTFISAKRKLLNAREKRIPPTIDSKILTAWNALMIKAMLLCGIYLHETKYITSAQQALNYILKNYWSKQRLLATHSLAAYLDDYAFLLDTLIVALQQAWRQDYLLLAIDLADIILKHFSNVQGGFYFTSNDHEKLLYRPKTMMDETLPAGNAVVAKSLLILGHLLGETRYIDAAIATLQAAWPMLTQYPAEHCTMLLALKEYLQPSRIIVIRGKNHEIKQWQDDCQTIHNYVFAIPDDVSELPGLLGLKKPREQACAYVCEGTQCLDVIVERKML